MRRHGVALFAGFITLVTLGVGCTPPATSVGSTTTTTVRATTTTTSTLPPGGLINRQSRSSVQNAYTDRLQPALAVSSGWNGSVAGCSAGSTTSAHQSATLTTVNWFREFVGLAPVTFDSTYSAKAQQAALMMQAKGSLSHYPQSDWPCYTANGAEAAGKSNLALGSSSGPKAIKQYIDDQGGNNTAVGHRRWILDPTRATMGSGTAGSANALWVLGGTRPAPSTPPVIAWPSDGFFPVELEPAGRWSLSIPGADFTNAVVTVSDSTSTTYSITKHPVAVGYGPNTIVWQVNGLTYRDGGGDRTFTVRVTGISKWTATSYSYTIKMFDAV